MIGHCLLSNVRNIYYKTPDLNLLLSTELLLLFCVTETWLNSSWNDNMVCDLPNYKLLRCDRIGHTGGGSCIIFNRK